MKIHIPYLFIVLFIVFINSCATAQRDNYSTKSKKAIKLYLEARETPSKTLDPKTGGPNFSGGISLLEKALEKDENFLEAHQLIGEFYRVTRNNEKAVYHFKRSLEIEPRANLNGLLYFDIGELQFQEGNYSDAIVFFDRVLEKQHAGISKDLYYAAQSLRESARFAIDAKKNPKNIDPKNIGPGINTEHPEYFPTLTVDGRTMLFTRELPNNDNSPRGQEDFFVSQLTDKNTWGKAVPMPPHINTSKNEGAPTLSADGRTLIFVACADERGDYGPNREGYGSCDLYITKRIGSTWTKPINLPGEVNSYNWESQPSLSSDGKTLYFVRRVGKRGQQRSDIFKSTLQPDGTWSKATPLPENINTPGMESSVHIHPDGRTLYFASNGHIGLGGSDLFMTQLQPDGTWSNPMNLGYPINTKNDENSLLVGPDGDIAFFASDRPGGIGKLDIYYFILPEELRPTPTTYFDGLVYDQYTKKPLAGKFELIDLETGNQVIESSADQLTGEFLVALPLGKSYALNVSFPGYAFFSENFDMIEKASLEGVHMDVPMIPIESEGAVTLANVFFDLGKSTLRKESYVELNKLVEFMKQNNSVKIEIGGHTDTRGDKAANQKLSEDRAKAVHDYLIENGVAKERLTYKGYGQTQPKISDAEIQNLPSESAKEKAHQLNRRTEYKFVK